MLNVRGVRVRACASFLHWPVRTGSLSELRRHGGCPSLTLSNLACRRLRLIF
jgi:hypothetical protein